MMYALLRRALFALDPEDAHDWTTSQMQQLQRIPLVLRAIERLCDPHTAPRTLLGLTFKSPMGIAGGFDKNATLMPFLAALGFGFLEVGTVTLRPQPGNPRPRMFRYPEEKALINRMGFNNDGADAVAARLRAWRTGNPACPVFVNVGKNRDVPLEGAVESYVECYRRVAPHADAAVLNLSSPNTPGLRDLQKPEHLEALLNAVTSIRSGPILIKIAPDLDETQIAEISEICAKKADGMICTNTTASSRASSEGSGRAGGAERVPPARPDPSLTLGMTRRETGGLSGQPLMEKSTRVLAEVRKRVGPGYPLIGVGGVFTAEDVRTKMRAGADLVQIYTSFIYEGPMIAKRLARA